MNSSDDHFKFNFSENTGPQFTDDETHDALDQQIFTTLQEMYRIDEEDQQAVQQAWQRIEDSSVQGRWTQAHVSRLESTKNPASSPFNDARSSRRLPKRVLGQRIETLGALMVAVLLLASMIGIVSMNNLARHNTNTLSPATPKQVPHTQTASMLLGTHLGALYLDMPITDIKFSNSTTKINDQQVLGILDNKQHFEVMSIFAMSKVIKLAIGSTFKGTTTEGFGLGMSSKQFQQLYRHFTITQMDSTTMLESPDVPILAKIIDTVYVVTDHNGTTLIAMFDKNKDAVEIVLQKEAPVLTPTIVNKKPLSTVVSKNP